VITTTYKCDRCGAEQTNPEQMWNVGISCKHADSSYGMMFDTPHHQELWCRKCCDELQIIGRPIVHKDQPAAPMVTLEEMIREIMREEIEAATGARA
jgi:hypothetical protein